MTEISRQPPWLVALSGPVEGRTWELAGEVFTLGRHSDNDLQIPHLEVSRHHGEIRQEDGRRVLRDLDSRHGIFVNTRPRRRHELDHGDVIQIGDTTLLYLDRAGGRNQGAGPGTGGAGSRIEDSGLVARTTVRKAPEETVFHRPDKARAALPPERLAADLQALLGISTALHEERRTDRLAVHLLDHLLEVLPAERGSVLLLEPGRSEPVIAAALDRSGERAPFPVSRTILAQVLSEGVGLLCNDLEREGNLGAADSVRGAEVRSVLCVPLRVVDRPLGVLYFDTRRPTDAFAESHLEVLSAAAGIASLALDNVHHLEWLRRENRRLRDEPPEHCMVGESPAMEKVFRLIERVAATDSTVLIEGESGTGKELAAHAIHRASPRAGRPFVAVNCATLSETLLESELFGHEKGAFTGAVQRKTGKVEAAHAGTLFLDEVGEIPPTLQVRLLRVLQEREVERVGGSQPIPVDVRVIAATNRDLEQAIRDGSFREDLYYRLHVIPLTMPPLRERPEDIPLLARHFARVHSQRIPRRISGFDSEALHALSAYSWPGNVRQLNNAVERAIVLGRDEVIRAADLPPEVFEGGQAAAGTYQATLAATKKKLLLDAFERAGGDYKTAARLLDLHPNSLHRLIRNLDLRAELERRGIASPER